MLLLSGLAGLNTTAGCEQGTESFDSSSEIQLDTPDPHCARSTKQTHMNKKILIILILTMTVMIPLIYFMSPGQGVRYTKKQSFDNVDVMFQFSRVVCKTIMDEDFCFIYFDYSINNKTRRERIFHPGKIRVRYNGVNNSSTEYDSIASAIPEATNLKKGNNDFRLYLVFKRNQMELKPEEFLLIDPGFH